MLQVEELDSILGRKRLSRAKAAKMCNVSPRTYYEWMKKKKMPTDKAEILIRELSLEDVEYIFFGIQSRNE